MENLIKLLIVFFLMPTLFSCETTYNPDNLDSSEKIPVIQGLITDQPGPYTVTLAWASAYNSSSTTTYIKGATVTITDDDGNTATLTEGSSGKYLTDSATFTGVPGKTYTLHVKLSDGTLYESTPALMNDKPSDFNAYAEIGTYNSVGTDAYGDVLVTTETGLYIKTNVSFEATSTRYLRFSTKAITEKTNTITPSAGYPYTKYTWTLSSLNDIPDVASTLLDSSKQMVVAHQLGFVQHLVSIDNVDDTTGPTVIRGWVTTTRMYAIPADAYAYYKSIDTQLSSDDQIFDPVASQIVGNLKCKTDSSKVALGLFEVASVLIKHDAFAWYNSSTYKHKVLASFTDTVTDGVKLSSPPGFWITFDKK
jgi:hypothetical protein